MGFIPKTKERQRRFGMILLTLLAVSLAVALIKYAFNQSINAFYTPSEVVNGKVPKLSLFNVGGFVVKNSINRLKDGLTVEFQVKGKGSNTQLLNVTYKGILPDMFKEGQYAVSLGQVEKNGTFVARKVLAKHDEKYIAPGEKALMDQAKKKMDNERIRKENARP